MGRHTRSREGCVRCREKKLKCDEAKPRCQQCQARGISCPGYRQHIRWSSKHELSSTNFPRRPKSPQSPRSPLTKGTVLPSVQTPSPSEHSPNPPESEFLPGSSFNASDNENNTYESLTADAEVSIDCGHQETPFAAALEAHGKPGDDLRLALHLDDDYPALFLDHYFDEICSLNVLFDYPDNPFRYLVESYLPSSALIYNCSISMSAAYLLQGNDEMIHVAIRYHSDAMKCLVQSIEKLESSIALSPADSETNYSTYFEEVLFASIILGISSPWSDPANLGTPHLLGARKICQRWLEVLAIEESDDILETVSVPQRSFLIGAMAYWEAFMSFVFDQPLTAVDYLIPFLQNATHTIPHPYTALSTPVFVNLSRLGICIRQNRAIRKFESLGWNGHMTEKAINEVMCVLAEVEEFAVNYQVPKEVNLEDPKQSSNTMQHFSSFGRLYQLATLIELYSSFPNCLGECHHRVNGDEACINTPSAFSVSGCQSSPSVTLFQRDDCKAQRQKLVSELANTFQMLLLELPSEGPSNLYQTLALLIYSNSLRNPKPSNGKYLHEISTQCLHQKLESQLLDLRMSNRQIHQARSLVRNRISVSCGYKGIQPVFQRALKLAEEIWTYLDTSCQDNIQGDAAVGEELHWIDIMIQNRLETMFG